MNLTQTDIQRFLEPISDAMPSGGNIEYEAIYEQINQARENDEETVVDDGWESKVRRADWAEVSRLCQQVLASHSKDLQIAAWLTQAQSELYGLQGMRAGLALITGLLTHFWPTLWPQLNDDAQDEVEMRYSRLQWLDKILSKQLEQLPLTDDGTVTLTAWQRVQYFEQRIAANASLRQTLLDDGYFGMERCNSSIQANKPDALIEKIDLIDEVNQQMNLLCQTAYQCAASMADPLRLCRQRLQEIAELLARFRDVIAPDMDVADTSVQSGSESENMTFSASSNHHDMRTQAIQQLLTISHYFRRNEPTSPVPYLLERAARWANMGMAEWLHEMMEENNSSALKEIMRVIQGREPDNS